MPPETTNTTPAGVSAGTSPEGAPEPGANTGDQADKQSRSKAWEAAEQYKSEASELRKRLKTFEDAEKQKADAEAIKRGEFEKLSAQEKQAREAAESRAANAQRRAALLEAAQKHGLSNTDYLKLIDESKLTIDGDKVEGASDAVRALKESHPELFGPADVKKHNTTTSTAPAGGIAFDPNKDLPDADVRKLTPEQHKQYGSARGWGGMNGKGNPRGNW